MTTKAQPLTFGGCPSCGSKTCVARQCARGQAPAGAVGRGDLSAPCPHCHAGPHYLCGHYQNPVARQAPRMLEDAARWQEHVGKLDALVAYCPTCCQGFIAQKEMTRDQIIFECGKTAGRAARKQGGA